MEEKIKEVKGCFYAYFDGKWNGAFSTRLGATTWLEDRDANRQRTKDTQSQRTEATCGKSCPCD